MEQRKVLVDAKDMNGRMLKLLYNPAMPDILILHINDDPKHPMDVTIYLIEPLVGEQLVDEIRKWLNAEYD